MKSGIYLITNTSNNKKYIGSSKRLKHRWYEHKHLLSNGKHNNRHLQNAWNKYGGVSFKYEVLEYCESEDLRDREDWWISLLDLLNRGYNKLSADRQIFSEETKAKMSASQKGKVISPEQRAMISKVHKGKAVSLETRAKQSAAHKGLTYVRKNGL